MLVHSFHSPVITIVFSSAVAGAVFAGTRGSGAAFSRDDGASWVVAAGLEARVVRVFATAIAISAAGTDRGVYLSQDGVTWSQSSLNDHSIDALAVEAIHTPARLVAGSDSPSGGTLPLFQSVDAGATWTQFTPPISGTYAVKLTAGPLPPTGNVRPLLAGTNTGLFQSNDNGGTFSPISGGQLLPTTDYTQAAFITDHFDRFYAGSDGGGSGHGGLWRTNDGGQTFVTLMPPQPSVTALAVSNDENPVLYVATFRPNDHTAQLWAYHDTGGTPIGPAVPPSNNASGGRLSSSAAGSGLAQLLASPQLPYIGLGLGAVAVILTAIAAHLHGRHR